VGAGAAILLAVSLIAGLIGTLWEARLARQERVNADRRFDDARKLANYLVFDLYGEVQSLPGSTAVQANMAERAMEYLDRLNAAKSGDPVLRAELAEGYLRLGDVLGNPFAPNLGQTPKALETYRKALAIAEPLAREAGNERGRLVLAKINQQLGGILVFSGQDEQGLGVLAKSADQFEKLVAEHPADASVRVLAGGAYHWLGRNQSQHGGWIGYAEKAIVSLNKSLAHLDEARRLKPGIPGAIPLLARDYQTLGIIVSIREPLRALEMYRKAIDLLDTLPERERDSIDTRRVRSAILQNVGWDQAQHGDYSAALATLEQARTVIEALYRGDPNNTAELYHRAIVYRNLGIVHGYAGHRKEALNAFGDGVKVYDELLQRDPVNRIYPLYRAELQARMSVLLTELGRADEARPYAEAGIGYMVKLASRPEATASQKIDAARYLMETSVASVRNYKLALEFAERADRMSQEKDTGALEYLAHAYSLTGNPKAAVETIRKALALLPPVQPGEKPSRNRAAYAVQLAEYEAQVKKGR
jgi:tetratricopeptide (TPR) repeat protein